MTRDEALEKGIEYVSIPGGKCGTLIQTPPDKAGVQIPGEEDMRWIPWADVKEAGGASVLMQAMFGGKKR